MRDLVFTSTALKMFEALDTATQKRIKSKLLRYINQDNPLDFAKRLISPRIGTWRRRIGNYRVIFDVDEKGEIIILLLIGHRKEIYK